MDFLIQIDAYDPVTTSATTLYAASADDDLICHLNSVTWWPVIARLPTLRQDWFDGSFANRITAPSSQITLAVEPWADFSRYAFTDARFRLWSGNSGDAWGSWTLRFDGRVTTQPSVAEGIATIEFAVDDRWLDGPLLATYAGTTGAEGAAAQKGVAKPLAIGAPRFAPGILIDQANNVVQLSSAGLIEDVEVAFVNLSRFSASVGDYASYAALVAASIPAGRWGTAKAVGMVRHGAPLAGKPSYHVKGDKAGTDGWARTPGEIIRRLARLSGGDPAKINGTSLDALDTARPWNLSLYLDQQTTARDQIQRIAASVNGVAGMSWLGQLFAAAIGIGTPTLSLAADGSALPPVASVEQITMGVPWWKLALQSEVTWAPHALSEVAFTGDLVPRGDYSSGTTYREGDIVKLVSNGVQYLYINPTPTSGNAPPNVTYWSVYESAPAWGTITGIPYDDILNNSDAAALDLNPSFEAWNGSYPDQWSFWAGSAPTKETSIVRLGSNAAKWVVASGDHGMNIGRGWTTAPMPVGTFIAGSIDIYLVARTSGLPGLYVRLYTNAAQTNYVDTAVQPPSTATGVWQRVPWSARVAAGQQIYGIGLYVMASWSSLPSGSFVGTVIFDNLDLAFFDNSIDNKAVSINANGTLNNGGGGAVTITGLGYGGDLNATRNQDGANMLEDPTKMRTWVAGAGTTAREDAGGAAGSGTPRDNFRIRLDTNDAFAFVQNNLIPVRPGEILYAAVSIYRAAAVGSARTVFGYWYYDGAGNFIGGSGMIDILDSPANTWAVYQSAFTTPGNASFIRPYFQRYLSGAGSSVYFSEPYIGRNEIGASRGAPSGTNVGSTAATTVEAGGNAANNGVNWDGTIKTDKVSTGSVIDSSISRRVRVERVSDVVLTNVVEVTVASLSITKLTNTSDIEVKTELLLSSSDDIRGNMYIRRDGNLVRYFQPYMNGAGGTFRVSQSLGTLLTGLGAGTYSFSVSFFRTGGASNVFALTGSSLSAEELLK